QEKFESRTASFEGQGRMAILSAKLNVVKIPISAGILRLQFYPSIKSSVSSISQQWPVCSRRSFSSSSNSSVTPSEGRGNLPSTSVTKTVKQVTKDVGYFAIVLGGIVLTGSILYTIIQELFSKKSPNGVFDDAFKICKTDNRVLDVFGSAIKAHGDPNSRGRRRHVAHDSWYDDKGRLHMAMKFYIKGNLASGIVHLEVVEHHSLCIQ
ncbi:Mitochondrial import inner membrane translocase subunit Tim21, partial [Schistosoma japonicum]